MIPGRLRFVYALLTWTLASVAVLSVLELVALDLLFVFVFVGFLFITELTEPVNHVQRWRDHLRWIILAGFLVFGYVVVTRVSTILQEGGVL
ncbi:hypothetical protein C453_12181 [Haloferax elongans ATCC BAA-1513]|uniref:Uncharacterized protein n=1 Tax=Haloferax elongans ATCC BAA-1513 TaxID=1230453 RepID=M0HLU1_HALEO|nr:hypothetical protein [Haloferax elongans]ELZ84773.1 hypothetical protein C453_12181 [Haloferax elongans ATCC BAA-1513]